MKRTKLQRAVAHLSAVRVGPGRWAHYADETGRWYVVSGDGLRELCTYLDDPDPSVSGDAYSRWCAGTTAEEMPKGWEP